MKIVFMFNALMTVTVLALAQQDARGSGIPSGLPDPTRPQVGAAPVAVDKPAEPTGPVLQSTMVSPTLRRAMISGRMYGVGDKLGAASITDIRPYEVVLREAGRERRLRLLPGLAKERSNADMKISPVKTDGDPAAR